MNRSKFLSFSFLLFLGLIGFKCGLKNSKTIHQDSIAFHNHLTDNVYSSELTRLNNVNEYPDGEYCAEVEYYNPKSGKSSNYTLIVEVDDNEISEIEWRNGGVLDHDHFDGGELDEEGHTSFEDDRGREFEIQITGPAENCFVNITHYVQCLGKTKNGHRCKRFTTNTNNLCWQHQNQK